MSDDGMEWPPVPICELCTRNLRDDEQRYRTPTQRLTLCEDCYQECRAATVEG